MDTTELLLKYDPKEAIVMMLNLENGTSFHAEDIEVGPPSAGTIRNTRVTLTVKTPASRNHEIPYSGQLTFEYNRLHVPHHFDGVLGGLDVTLPTSSQILLNEITARVGQRFVLDDFVLEDIGRHNAYAYLLRAKVESHRWYGGMVVRLGDVASLEDALGALMPDTLGELENPYLFNSVNASYPYMNGTPFQSEIDALVLNQPAQFDPKISEIISAIAPMSEAPGYRVPLHRNTHFEQSNVGWSVTVDSLIPNAEPEGSYSFQFNRCHLLFVNDIVTVSRSQGVVGGMILEVTFRVDQFAGSGTSDMPVELQIVHPDGTIEANAFVTVSSPGFYHTYIIAPKTGTRLLKWVAAAVNRDVILTELSWRSFPTQWILQDSLDFSTLSHVDSAPTALSLVDGKLRYGQYGTGSIRFPTALASGRHYAFSFDIAEIGDGVLYFQAKEIVSGTVHALGTYQCSTAEHGIGQRQSAILYVPPDLTMDWQLQLAVTSPGISTTQLERLRLRMLPLPHAVNAIRNYDFHGRTAVVEAVGQFGATAPVPGSGSLSYQDGFLSTIVTTNQGFGVRFKTPPLHRREQYRLTVDSVTARVFDPNTADYYTGIKVTQPDGTMNIEQNGVWSLWNQTLMPRFLNPFLQQFRGQGSVWLSNAPVTIELYAFAYASGLSIPGPLRTAYERVSVEIEYPVWVNDAGAGERNLYNARLVTRGATVGLPLNSIRPGLLHTHTFALDMLYSSEFSVNTITVPYMPEADIQNRFLSISQFGRYGAVTTEDMSAYREHVSVLTATTVIGPEHLPQIMFCDPTQTSPWFVSPLPMLKNLYGATVQYNGPIRPTDPVPMNTGLDQIIVLFLNPTLCTGYKGQIRFYYNGRYPT